MAARLAPLSLALLALLPGPARAQDACFNGAPRSRCSDFWIGEVAVALPVVSSPRSVQHGSSMQARPIFGKQLEWQVGFMHNVADRWAVGGALGLGPGSRSPVTSLTARTRRWLTPSVGLDGSAGLILRSPGGSGGSLTGGRADVRLNFGDDVYVGIRSERLTIDPTLGGDYATGPHHATSLLFGLGTEWAIGSTVVVTVGAVALVLLVLSAHGPIT